MTPLRSAGFAALLFVAPVFAQSGNPVPLSGARDTLRTADQRLSRAVFEQGLAEALSTALAPDAVLMLEGAPLVRGREGSARLLAAQRGLASRRVSWEPFRLLLSRDAALGVSFGATVVQRNGEPPAMGRYVSVWRRSAAGAWQLAAQLVNGLFAPGETVLPPGLGSVRPGQSGNPFAEADLAFAKLAAKQGAPAAFAHYVAPDGMTLAPTGELNLGPRAVRARLLESRGATAQWRWWPVVTLAAPSGDLGVTIGEAEIRSQSGGAPVHSKYLTVWQRQPEGSLKFVLDAGSGRPAP